MKFKALVIGGCLMAAMSSSLHANLLLNGSFENGTFTDTGGGYNLLGPGATAIADWTTLQGDLVWGGPVNVDSVVAPAGGHFLDLTSYGAGFPLGGLTQTIATIPGETYHFSLTLFDPFDPGSLVADIFAGATHVVLSASGGFDFVATGSSTVIQILGNSGGSFLGVDDAEVILATEAVPEASAVPAGWGLIAVVGFVWQFRQSAKRAA